MIFVVGIPRSGTTWVSSLLAEHPTCERLTYEHVWGEKPPKPTLETGLFMRGLSDDEVRRRVPEPPEGKQWVEKTPGHWFCTPQIRRVFPEAKIVVTARDRYDTTVSMCYAEHWEGRPRSVEEADALYFRYLSHIDTGLMEWDVQVDYKTLWRSPVAETRRLFASLGLPPDYAPEAVRRTHKGRNLPHELKHVFRVGEPSS